MAVSQFSDVRTRGLTAIGTTDIRGALSTAAIAAGGNATFAGTVIISGTTSLLGTLSTAAANIGGALAVAGNSTFSGTTSLLGTLAVGGAVVFSGTTALLGTLSCTGAAQFSSTVAVGGALTVLGALTGAAASFSRVISRAAVPDTATATGEPGEYAANSSTAFMYICVASNSWYRVAVTNSAFA